MHENDPGGALGDGEAEDFPGMHDRGVQDPPGDQDVAHDLVLRVEEEDVELLLPEVLKMGGHPMEDVRGPLKARSGRVLLDPRPPPQLQASEDAARRGGPDPRDGAQ